MTVSYQYDVASSASGGFIRLLFRWRGSVWKVVYREMSIFTVCYVLLTLLYMFALTDSQQRIFEKIVYFCSTFMEFIPLSFMLGFYVSFIAARWWSQFTAIPWPDKLMNIIAMYVPGFDESSRVVRRTLMRYLNLSLVLVLRSISMAVKRRFPTKEHLIEAGFMTKTELDIFQSVPSTEFNTFWIPVTWFINVLREARQECRITDSNGLKLIMEELNEFRSKCGLLWGYDWISIPLVYTQVVTMATYAFYVACMFGRQNVNVNHEINSPPREYRYDYYIPVFTILQLMFYMGLLKVAEQLINPFGDDDEDFELNWIIDRHMKVSYLGVDTLNVTPPPLVKDTYYNELDVKIPYTEASKSYKKKTYRGSVAYMQVPMEQQGMVLPDMSEDEDDGEASESMGPRRPSTYTLFQSRGSNCKGMSPASSFTNLDNRSTASVDSDLRGSSANVASAGAKNASGTMGYNQASPPFVDMATAEDDEIVLQEVIVDPNLASKPSFLRSDSLQIPGQAEPRKSPSLLNILRGVSPKIAPKFPREKLKSMFRKSRRMSTAFPFYKMKGVHFSRDTKEELGGDSVNQSLLDVSLQPVDVDITLSTPELTEIEKETGIHPYFYTQQTVTSHRQPTTGRAFSIIQPELQRYGSEDKETKMEHLRGYAKRSSSLPNIHRSDTFRSYIRDPIVESSLKKISTATMKGKEQARKPKMKRKSPPPPPLRQRDDDVSSEFESQDDSEYISDSEPGSRRSTLPQITLTQYDHKPAEHLDLPTTAASSEHSSSPSSDSKSTATQVAKVTPSPSSKLAPVAQRPTQTRLSETSASDEDTQASDITPSDPSTHSTPRRPVRTSPQSQTPTPSKTVKMSTIEETPKTSSYGRRRSPPPPRRPETLLFSPRRGTGTKKIAGISLKSVKPTSPTSRGVPTSPTSSIPSSTQVGRAPTFPKTSKKADRTTTPSEGSTPTYQLSKADTTITISDSQEELREDQSRAPEVPQRRIPKASSKDKK